MLHWSYNRSALPRDCDDGDKILWSPICEGCSNTLWHSQPLVILSYLILSQYTDYLCQDLRVGSKNPHQILEKMMRFTQHCISRASFLTQSRKQRKYAGCMCSTQCAELLYKLHSPLDQVPFFYTCCSFVLYYCQNLPGFVMLLFAVTITTRVVK